MDTIFALSTGSGKAGVAIVRVSGPHAHEVCKCLTGNIPTARTASLRSLKDNSDQLIDEALVLLFDENQSFTGEKSVEFQVHGSVAVVNAILDIIGKIKDCRHAEAGEFTRRAIENGRLDLAQVEGLADLIDSETEAQRRQALKVFSGHLGKKAENWRRDLIRAAALLEATIDFADEEIPENVFPEVSQLIDKVVLDLSVEAAGVTAAERIRSGFEVAIVGAPNVGKSTLLNALAGREAAITSEHAGTTRDVIEVRMDIDGLAVTLLDTAGIRQTEDAVEQIGVNLAKRRAQEADIRVFLLNKGEKPIIEPQAEDIIRYAKADLRDDDTGGISGKSGQGISRLINDISNILKIRTSSTGVATRYRHKVAIEKGLISLQEVKKMINVQPETPDIIAEEVHFAIRALDSLVGRINVEDVLDEIFASFCIGK